MLHINGKATFPNSELAILSYYLIELLYTNKTVIAITYILNLIQAVFVLFVSPHWGLHAPDLEGHQKVCELNSFKFLFRRLKLISFIAH